MKTLFAAALTSTVLLASPLALSDQQKNAAMEKGMGMDKCMKMGGAMMAMVDTNKDGVISRDEFNKHHEQMFTQLDGNADGMVDANERQAMQKQLNERIKDMRGMPNGMGDMHGMDHMHK